MWEKKEQKVDLDVWKGSDKFGLCLMDSEEPLSVLGRGMILSCVCLKSCLGFWQEVNLI